MSNISSPHLSTDEYRNAVKSNTIRPRYKICVLRQNDTIQDEILDDIIYGSGSLSVNYQQGQRRSLNFALKNPDGKWTPNPNSNYLWVGSKFKLYLGMEFEGITYWHPNGVFVVSDPSVIHNGSDKQVSLQCYDKFALLDGTLGGNTEGTYIIPQGTNIKQAIEDILMLDNGNGYPMDTMPLLFDNKYQQEVTAYTITKNPNSSLGEIIIELADMIACDVYYNENGNLVFQSGIVDIAHLAKPVLWSYSDLELEYLSSSLIHNYSKIKNRVTVVAANVNTNLIYSALSENHNPVSPTRIQKIGIKNYYLEDNNIYSDELAQDRADYELNKFSILQLTNTLSSTFMIHLDVNNCIEVTDRFLGLKNARFIIQSLNIPISTDSRIDINASNIAELPFYPS